jgi:sulfite oxidase
MQLRLPGRADDGILAVVAAYGTSDAMILHGEDPLNAEPPGALLAEHALTPAACFFVRNHGDVPAVDADAWRLRVGGLVERAAELSLADLRALPRHELTVTLECAGNRRAGLIAVRDIPGEAPWGPGAMSTATWAGAALADVLARTGVAEGAAHVAFVGADRCRETEELFGGSVPLEKALRAEVLLAFEMNGEPLPPVHGAPVRVVVPGYIGARSVKWVDRIEVRDAAWDGWFQAVAYRLLAPDETPGRGRGVELGELALTADVLVPADGADVPAGPTQLRGIAHAGGERRLVRVDVSTDGGGTWLQASLLEDLGRWAWRRWTATVDLAPGEHEIVVRAWDSAAATQPADPAHVWNPKGYVNTAWGRVRLTARARTGA